MVSKESPLARSEDSAWEKTIADSIGRPKLDQFVREALAEGTEPLDLDRLAPLNDVSESTP